MRHDDELYKIKQETINLTVFTVIIQQLSG